MQQQVFGDQEISPDLYRDALLLSHLARSVLTFSCAAVRARTGGNPQTPDDCAIEGRFMDRFGDPDTMATMARLYSRVAATIGETTEAERDLSLLTPSAAAGRAFDLVGMIAGNVPRLRLEGPRKTTPLFLQFLAANGAPAPAPSTAPAQRSLLLPIIGGVVALAAGVGIGYLLSR